MNRRMFLTSTAALAVVRSDGLLAATRGDEEAAYRQRLVNAALGFRERRSREPHGAWPAPPRARAPIGRPDGQVVEVRSPDGRLKVLFACRPEAPAWWMDWDDREVIAPSRLGFAFRDSPVLQENLKIIAQHRRVRDEVWEQPWGECRKVHDHCNELELHLQEASAPFRLIIVTFRVFDTGAAFRIEYPVQAVAPSAILEERTEFVLPRPDRTKLWWLPAYGFARDEYLYRCSTAATVQEDPDASALHTPLTAEMPGMALCFHEAALKDYAGMNLAPQPGGILRCDLTPWSDGDRVKPGPSFRTPWRVIMIGENASDLVSNMIALNLNDPAQYDADWFRPGKYVGIWWGYIINYWDREPGPHYGATTERVLKYLDFAAEHGFGVLIESWNKGWEHWREQSGIDFAAPSAMFDEERVLAEARRLGVTLIGHHETSGDVARYDANRERAFASLRKWHSHVVKTGYVASQPGLIRIGPEGATREWHYGQYMVGHQQDLVEFAARERVSVIAHETVKDTGLRRTYPNFVSRECAIGQEYNGFDSVHGGTPPDHEPTLVFTRMLAGPMDYTAGIFDIDLSGLKGMRGRVRREVLPDVRPNSTLARQLALYVVLYSPMQMAADFIENYAGHRAFRFIKEVPVDWDLTRGLSGQIGQYAAIARKDRNSSDWYLGAITNASARTLPVDLNFLSPGVVYDAEMYCDDPESHFATNPKAWLFRKETVTSSSLLSLHLAPGGGIAIRFRAKQ